MRNEKPVTVSGRLTTVTADSREAIEPSEQVPITVADTLFGTDPPIEKAHPGLQPALVFLSYPLVLIILVLIISAYFMFNRGKPNKENLYPIPPESVKSVSE